MQLMTTVIQFPGGASGRPLVATVSNEVRALLGRYDVTQTELAQWLSLTQSAISARLRGATEWKVAEIDRIATGFNVHPAVLMGGFAPNPPEGPLPILKVRPKGFEPLTFCSGSVANSLEGEVIWGEFGNYGTDDDDQGKVA